MDETSSYFVDQNHERMLAGVYSYFTAKNQVSASLKRNNIEVVLTFSMDGENRPMMSYLAGRTRIEVVGKRIFVKDNIDHKKSYEHVEVMERARAITQSIIDQAADLVTDERRKQRDAEIQRVLSDLGSIAID
jgi:hypothetical protein